MVSNYADLDSHMELFDALLGPELSKNREIRFDYDVGRDARPDTLRPGREFFRVQITTRNIYHNPVRVNWFYHSVPDRSGWFMTSLSMRGLGFQEFQLSPLSELPNLEYLDFQGNQLEEFDLSYLSSPYHLHTINLSSNSISSLDLSPLFSYSNLRLLNLHENQLKELDIFPLRGVYNLNRLVLSFNQIESIDLHPISDHKYLMTLDISYNKIKELDIPLRNLNLSSLILNDNLISKIKFSGDFPELSLIQISNNPLNSFSFRHLFKKCPSLKKLFMWGCQLEKIDFSDIDHWEIEEINLNSNRIKTVKIEGNYPNLVYLELGYNQIDQLDLSGLIAPKLENLNLTCNPLSKILFPKNCGNFKTIDLSGTKLDELHISMDFSNMTMQEMKVGILVYQKLYNSTTEILVPQGCKLVN